MARSKADIPPFRVHKPTGQGYALLDGERKYLGRADDPATREKYDRVIREWLSNGRRLRVSPDDFTVAEMLDSFLAYAETYYRKSDGTETTSLENFKLVMKPLRKMYATTTAAKFGPTSLRAIRDSMVDGGASRVWANRSMNLIRSIFRWAVSRELLPVHTLQALATVEPLRKGRTKAPEYQPIRPVPDANVEAVIVRVSRQVAALIELQLLTGARAGELVGMKATDLDTSGRIWIYRPATHKTEHHGHERTIYIGKRGQEILRRFMVGRAVDKPFFSPQEAERERYAACKVHRHQAVPPAKTDRKIGEVYTVDAYRHAIHRACAELKIPVWGPHRLRHNAGTALRKEFGLEAARIILGHRSPAVTNIYAEIDQGKALEVMEKVG